MFSGTISSALCHYIIVKIDHQWREIISFNRRAILFTLVLNNHMISLYNVAAFYYILVITQIYLNLTHRLLGVTMVLISLGIVTPIAFASVALAYCVKLVAWKKKCRRKSILNAKRNVWRNRRHTFKQLKNLLNRRKGNILSQKERLSQMPPNRDYSANIERFYKNILPYIPQQEVVEPRPTQDIQHMAKKRKFQEDTDEEECFKKRRISEDNQLEEESVIFNRNPPIMAKKRRFMESTSEEVDSKKRKLDAPPVKWLPQLGLFQEDKMILQSEEFLNNQIVDAAQSLLKSQFKTEGLQSIINSIYSFNPVHGKSVQLHFDPERLHCFVSCFRKNHVEIADSGSFPGLSQSAQRQIKECYKDVVQDPIKTMTFLKVDTQPNNYDCGVYAIAYAYELLSRTGNPTCKFQSFKMRKHLIRCLENGRITAFPRKIRPGLLTLNC
ncbi:hypothetical protein XENTR_v10015834 [Xenopus tropicalis]|nr:hypothetical protein XENTR_v10015834 [Xenopus tropicalis]